jgi:hypothetical protein
LTSFNLSLNKEAIFVYNQKAKLPRPSRATKEFANYTAMSLLVVLLSFRGAALPLLRRVASLSSQASYQYLKPPAEGTHQARGDKEVTPSLFISGPDVR